MDKYIWITVLAVIYTIISILMFNAGRNYEIQKHVSQIDTESYLLGYEAGKLYQNYTSMEPKK